MYNSVLLLQGDVHGPDLPGDGGGEQDGGGHHVQGIDHTHTSAAQVTAEKQVIQACLIQVIHARTIQVTRAIHVTCAKLVTCSKQCHTHMSNTSHMRQTNHMLKTMSYAYE